jgi:hypothetical protein
MWWNKEIYRSEHCNLLATLEVTIRDHFVGGIMDHRIRRRVLSRNYHLMLDYKTAHGIPISMEIAENNVIDMLLGHNEMLNEISIEIMTPKETRPKQICFHYTLQQSWSTDCSVLPKEEGQSSQ